MCNIIIIGPFKILIIVIFVLELATEMFILVSNVNRFEMAVSFGIQRQQTGDGKFNFNAAEVRHY